MLNSRYPAKKAEAIYHWTEAWVEAIIEHRETWRVEKPHVPYRSTLSNPVAITNQDGEVQLVLPFYQH